MKCFFLGFILILPVFLFGCPRPKPVCVRDDSRYCQARGVFTYQWYDYYQRALSCMEGECYAQALADLDEALKQKFEDERMARTYGMHLMDYFPHREKGMIHYLRGDDDAAEQELGISLRHETSAKARFYLDKVRKRIMDQKGGPVSIPRVMIAEPSQDETHTRNDPVVISGTAADDHYVSKILVANQPVFMEASARSVPFKAELRLDQGRHEIEIIARNLGRGTATLKRIVHVDRSGPVIVIEKIEPGVRMQGKLFDESEPVSFFVNGEEVPVSEGKEVEFSVLLKSESLNLAAMDSLGNETHAFVETEERKTKNKIWPALLPGDWEIPRSGFGFGNPNRAGWGQEGRGRVERNLRDSGYLASLESDMQRLAVTDTGRSYLTASHSEVPGPEIILDKLSDQNVVFSEIISVKGRVSGEGNVKAVLVNNIPVLRIPGRVIFFNHSTRLIQGENIIHVRAMDESGRQADKRILIIRKLPEVFRPAYRCVFKTHPFKTVSFDNADHRAQGVLLQHLFLDRLMAKKRFQIRMQSDLKELLDQQNLMLRLFPTSCHEKFQATAFMLSGYVYRTRIGVEVVAEVTDFRTSEILDIENEAKKYVDMYAESRDISVLKPLADSLSEKFHRAFPLMTGRIIQKTGDRFLTIMTTGEMKMMKWPLVVGSDTEFAGDAEIVQTLIHGKYWIKLRNETSGASVMNNWVITQ